MLEILGYTGKQSAWNVEETRFNASFTWLQVYRVKGIQGVQHKEKLKNLSESLRFREKGYSFPNISMKIRSIEQTDC